MEEMYDTLYHHDDLPDTIWDKYGEICDIAMSSNSSKAIQILKLILNRVSIRELIIMTNAAFVYPSYHVSIKGQIQLLQCLDEAWKSTSIVSSSKQNKSAFFETIQLFDRVIIENIQQMDMKFIDDYNSLLTIYGSLLSSAPRYDQSNAFCKLAVFRIFEACEPCIKALQSGLELLIHRTMIPLGFNVSDIMPLSPKLRSQGAYWDEWPTKCAHRQSTAPILSFSSPIQHNQQPSIAGICGVIYAISTLSNFKVTMFPQVYTKTTLIDIIGRCIIYFLGLRYRLDVAYYGIELFDLVFSTSGHTTLNDQAIEQCCTVYQSLISYALAHPHHNERKKCMERLENSLKAFTPNSVITVLIKLVNEQRESPMIQSLLLDMTKTYLLSYWVFDAKKPPLHAEDILLDHTMDQFLALLLEILFSSDIDVVQRLEPIHSALLIVLLLQRRISSPEIVVNTTVPWKSFHQAMFMNMTKLGDALQNAIAVTNLPEEIVMEQPPSDENNSKKDQSFYAPPVPSESTRVLQQRLRLDLCLDVWKQVHEEEEEPPA